VVSLDGGPASAAGGAVAEDPDDTLQHDALPPDVPPPDDEPPVPPAVGDGGGEPKTRRFTWRVAVFVLALLLLAVVVVGALGWYARNTYFVTIQDEQVVIFKGRPGGFLWFDPTLEQETGIAVEDVPEAVLPDLEAGVDQGTLSDAENYVANLEDQIAQQDDETTTTTTTTEPATTTTKPDRQGGGGTGGGTTANGNG
jgi:protein phosphatase